MKRLWVFAWAVILVNAAPAAAQSTYVGASVFGDIVRVSNSRSVFSEDTGGGEAVGFTLRVGTPLGDRWGIEAEFARPAEFEEPVPSGPVPLRFLPGVVETGVFNVTAGAGALPSPLIFPPFTYRTTHRNTTFSTAAWLRQDFTARTSLVYLGGLGFYRSEREFQSSFDPRALLGGIALSILPYSSETVVYGVSPFVGVEGRVGLGEHAQLVPGFRFHGFDDTWLLRPSVGLNWRF